MNLEPPHKGAENIANALQNLARAIVWLSEAVGATTPFLGDAKAAESVPESFENEAGWFNVRAMGIDHVIAMLKLTGHWKALQGELSQR